MPRVDNFILPPEYEELWKKACVYNQSYFGDKVDKKNIIWRRRNFPSLIARGNFQGLAQLWNSLTWSQQSDWDDAGYYSGQSGWDLFAQDTLYRIANGLQGVATPNLYHQFKIGELIIPAPITHVKISQTYNFNNVSDKTFMLNLFSNLVSVGAGSYAEVRFIVTYWDDWNLPAHLERDDEFTWDISDLAGWDWFGDGGFSTTLVKSIEFEIEIYNMQGIVYFDGMTMIDDLVNVAVDWQCAEVEFHWSKIVFPSGTILHSIYPPDNI